MCSSVAHNEREGESASEACNQAPRLRSQGFLSRASRGQSRPVVGAKNLRGSARVLWVLYSQLGQVCPLLPPPLSSNWASSSSTLLAFGIIMFVYLLFARAEPARTQLMSDRGRTDKKCVRKPLVPALLPVSHPLESTQTRTSTQCQRAGGLGKLVVGQCPLVK